MSEQNTKPDPLNIWITVDANGGVLLRGKDADLERLQDVIGKARERLADGDGSITVTRKKGKGTGPLTVVCFE